MKIKHTKPETKTTTPPSSGEDYQDNVYFKLGYTKAAIKNQLKEVERILTVLNSLEISEYRAGDEYVLARQIRKLQRVKEALEDVLKTIK